MQTQPLTGQLPRRAGAGEKGIAAAGGSCPRVRRRSHVPAAQLQDWGTNLQTLSCIMAEVRVLPSSAGGSTAAEARS